MCTIPLRKLQSFRRKKHIIIYLMIIYYIYNTYNILYIIICLYIYIIMYMLLQVLWDNNLQAYTILMFIYLKRQIKLALSTTIQDKQCLKKYYLFFTFANKNLFKCLHLLISSDFLFRRFLLLTSLIIHSFSIRHN